MITSSWDDLTAGIQNTAQSRSRRSILKRRYLELIRDQHKPKKPRLDLRVHQSVIVDGKYTRQLINYAVVSDERAHAYLGIPLDLKTKARESSPCTAPSPKANNESPDWSMTPTRPTSITSAAAAMS